MTHSFVRRAGGFRLVARHRASRLVALGLVTGALAGATAAQATLHVSTSADTTVGAETYDDAALLSVDGSTAVTPVFTEEHWLATVGSVPTDVDAFGRVPWAAAGSAQSFAFSFLSNEFGFLDGDVLTFAPGGGLRALVTEDELVTALGVPSASVDVDALDFDAAGCLYVSFQSDLAGTILGDLNDGDVLCYEQGLGQISLFRTESEVQTAFSNATGIGTAISDVQALDVVGGELWVVTQSPSSDDGSVIAVVAAPYVVQSELTMGLNGAEIDGLSVATAADTIPVLSLAPDEAQPGDTITVSIDGRPNSVYIALMAGTPGWVDFSQRPGFGAWYLDPRFKQYHRIYW